MLTLNRLFKRGSLWRTSGSVACLLVLSVSTLSQTETQNRVVAERTKDKNTIVDANAARERLTTTIVALASVGETDSAKLQRFALKASDNVVRQ